MNKLEFKGKITKIFQAQTGETSNGEWKSIEFLVEETKEQYPQSALFRLFGIDKVDNFEKYNNVGDEVTVSFNLKSREYNDKYFNSLDAWKVWKENATQQSETVEEEAKDDLPF